MLLRKRNEKPVLRRPSQISHIRYSERQSRKKLFIVFSIRVVQFTVMEVVVRLILAYLTIKVVYRRVTHFVVAKHHYQ